MKKTLLLFLALFVLVAVVVSVYLRPQQQAMLGLEPAETIEMAAEADCDIRLNTCRASVGEYSLGLHLATVVRPLQPFEVKLQAEGWQPQQAVIYISMQGMGMGLNRFLLKPLNGEWSGNAMLPVCTDKRSDWLATVFVSHQGKRYRAEYSFSQAEPR